MASGILLINTIHSLLTDMHLYNYTPDIHATCIYISPFPHLPSESRPFAHQASPLRDEATTHHDAIHPQTLHIRSYYNGIKQPYFIFWRRYLTPANASSPLGTI